MQSPAWSTAPISELNNAHAPPTAQPTLPLPFQPPWLHGIPHRRLAIGSHAASTMVGAAAAHELPDTESLSVDSAQLMSCTPVGGGSSILDAHPEGNKCRRHLHGPWCHATSISPSTTSLVVRIAQTPAMAQVCSADGRHVEDPAVPIWH